VAAAAVGRVGAVAPVSLANLGSALTAGLAPVAGRVSVFDRLFRMLAPFRYSRYDDSDPLEHDARADVYDVVNDAPGAYLSEVADEAGLPLSTARHHIRVLEREDLVSGAKVRGKRRFYPAYTQGIELAAALNDEATAVVIDAISRLGASSVSDLADELGRDPSTVSHHLKRLAEDDIIVRERDGRAVMNKLSAEARTALEPGHDSPTVEAGEALASD
jgi:predicted transcriptional regulator